MYVSDEDIAFYSTAVEEIVEKMAIVDDLVKYGGMSSFPIEDTSVMIISGIKEWIISEDGERWLNTMGYHRYDYPVTSSGAIVCSGTTAGYNSFCPVCSGIHSTAAMFTCEKCGKSICNCCGVQVDNIYGVIWCSSCVATFL